MEKNKIAEGIIIRVGGGIREVYRQPLDAQDAIEPSPTKPSVEKLEEEQNFPIELDPPASIS